MTGRMRNLCFMLGGHRRVKGLSLDYVARVVGLLDPQFLAEIEQGSHVPSLELLCDLATLYDLSIDRLVGRERSESPPPAQVSARAPVPPPAPAPRDEAPRLPTLHLTPELFAAVTAYAQEHDRRVGDVLLQAITWRIGLSVEDEQRYFPR